MFVIDLYALRNFIGDQGSFVGLCSVKTTAVLAELTHQSGLLPYEFAK